MGTLSTSYGERTDYMKVQIKYTYREKLHKNRDSNKGYSATSNDIATVELPLEEDQVPLTVELVVTKSV